MRIALFCPSFGQVGGIERKAERLVVAFRHEGHEVTVLARGAPTVAGPATDVPVVRVPYHQLPRRTRHVARQLRFLRELPGAVSRLREAAAEARSDVALALAVSSYAPYAIALASAAPVVLSLEGGGPGFTRHPRVMRWALRRAARVVACASSLARTALDLAPEIRPRLRVVPNGVDPERFAEGTAFPHPGPYVLAVARLSHEKGIDVLLDAFARLRDLHVDLLVAGDGPERPTLEQQRDGLELGGRVHFLGTVDAERMPALHRGALLLACPSRWEGLPLVCLEAMAAGRAVVATAVDGTPDAVLAGESGLLVPPEDPGALAAALEVLLRDPQRRAALGARGHALVRERFTWDAVARRYLEVLTEAARER